MTRPRRPTRRSWSRRKGTLARHRAHAGLFAEARGRSERAFGPLQDRLPKELALAGIVTAANRFLREVYLPEHNAHFTVAPEQVLELLAAQVDEVGRPGRLGLHAGGRG